MIGFIGGHGGYDRGTTMGGIDEADLNLDMSHEAHASCSVLWPAEDFCLLRECDENVSLDAAAQRAAERDCTFVVIQHTNAHKTAPLHGVSTYAWPGDEAAIQAGDAILSAYPQELAPMRKTTWEATDNVEHDDDWLQRPRHVLGPFARRGISALLVEMLYASFKMDVEAVAKHWVRERITLAIAGGVARYLQRVRLVC